MFVPFDGKMFLENGRLKKKEGEGMKPFESEPEFVEEETRTASYGKGALVFSLIAKILFGVEVLAVVGATVYLATLRLLPTNYIIAICVAVALVVALQAWLVFSKKRPVLKGVISLVLALVLLFVYGYGAWMLGTVHNSLSNLPEETPEVPPVIVEVREQPFFIYLSGMDNTAGSDYIAERGLSDVNMVIGVDPEDHKILMISIPRDYYVPLYGDTNKMDKLTHSGSYGVGCSMETMGAVLGIDFNYYVKVNFKSLHDIVNALDGITVNSEIAFTSEHSYSGTVYDFKKGINQLDGDAALAFVRERKSIGGDLQRNKHQQLVIKGIIDKAISPAILNPNKLGKVLNSVTKNTKTNISQEDIQKLIQMQLDEMPKWDISSFSMVGKGAYRPSYAAGGQELSVVIPDEESVANAKAAIQEFLPKN